MGRRRPGAEGGPYPAATPGAWGPDGRRGAVSVTFDNLGEAAEIEQGLWPPERPVGAHPSVTDGLPWVLRLLEDLGLRATFFVEGLNAETYPEAVASIPAAGHEVAYHAWRHEVWAGLDPEQERRNLARGLEAFGTLGIEPRGFRPPGGGLNPSSPTLLEALGFRYCSPEGESAGAAGGVAVLPFRWPLVDAYYLYGPLGGLREEHGDPRDPLPVSSLPERVLPALELLAGEGGHLCLLFHPFLLLTEERRVALRDVLEEVRRLDAAGDVWCTPCGEVAEHLLLREGDVTRDEDSSRRA